MATHQRSAALACALALASFSAGSDGARAADLYIEEGPIVCRTVFTGPPTPPYFARHGCVHNVITVHRLPERRRDHLVVRERDVLIDPDTPPAIYVYK